MDLYETGVKRIKLEILEITLWSFKTDKGYVKKEYCIYKHPPYVGQKIWVRENRLFKI